MFHSDYWYAQKGPDNDVVISSRVRLYRNLVNFPFPRSYNMDDADRVTVLLFDAFSHIADSDKYQTIPSRLIKEENKKIFVERGILDENSFPNVSAAIKNDGKIACAINETDHLKISSFTSGFDPEKAFSNAKKLDDELQKIVQFAANYEFGFLTSNVKDSGSGMKVSVRLHLPSLSFLDSLKEVVDKINSKNSEDLQVLEIDGIFGAGENKGSSLGNFYNVSTKFSSLGTEADQIGSLVVCVKEIIKKERKARSECLKNSITRVYNEILRSFAMAKFSTLMDVRESIEILSKIKWGLDMKLLKGITSTEIFALLYEVQNAHVDFLYKQSKFELEDDIVNDKELMIKRVRALIIRDAMEKVKLLEN